VKNWKSVIFMKEQGGRRFEVKTGKIVVRSEEEGDRGTGDEGAREAISDTATVGGKGGNQPLLGP
jgi:hypothetical protein